MAVHYSRVRRIANKQLTTNTGHLILRGDLLYIPELKIKGVIPVYSPTGKDLGQLFDLDINDLEVFLKTAEDVEMCDK